jgi:tRNA pseudouridine55 synthase
VRALARDIASSLGTHAFASSIRRTAVGEFTLDNAVGEDELEHISEASVITVRKACVRMPQCVLSRDQQSAIRHGNNVALEGNGAPGGVVLAFDNADRICGVLEKHAPGLYHPVRVFI